MIEVPEEKMKGKLIDTLWNCGIKSFHIDAGDGQFVTRKFCGINKTKLLREREKKIVLEHKARVYEMKDLANIKKIITDKKKGEK